MIQPGQTAINIMQKGIPVSNEHVRPQDFH